MNRRDFFKRFSAVPIAAALAPVLAEELLLKYRQAGLSRTIFLPPRGGWSWMGYNYSLTDGYYEDVNLVEITRAAFVPKMVNEIYQSSPIMDLIIKRINEFEHSASAGILGLYDPHPVGLARLL